MTRTWKIAGVAVLAAVLAAGIALAGPGHRREAWGEGHPGVGLLHRWADQLDLTQDQRQQIRGIVEAHWEAGLGDAAQAARGARRGLQDILRDPAADEAKVREAARQSSWAEENLAVERHKTFVEAYSVLTPDQQVKAKDLLDRRRARSDRRFGALDDRLRR